MGRQFRRSTSAPFFHVTTRTARQSPVFTRPVDYRAFLQVLSGGLDRFPVRLMAYSVLSNHWQLVLEPDGRDVLAGFLGWVSSSHLRRYRRQNGTAGPELLDQGQLQVHRLATAASLVRVCRSVEREALTAGLVGRAQDWPWCSLSDRYRSDLHVPLTPAPFLGSGAWIDHVNAPSTPWDLAIEHRDRALADDPTVFNETARCKLAGSSYVTRPITQAGSPDEPSDVRTASASDAAQTRIRPIPMLKARNISRSSMAPARWSH